MHVFAHLPHSSAVLLDQTHHQAAAGLAVVRVVILLVQSDHKLWVGPEAVCDVSGETTEVRISRGHKVCCVAVTCCQVSQVRQCLTCHKVKCYQRMNEERKSIFVS